MATRAHDPATDEPQPLYQQLVETVRQRIKDGRLKPGDQVGPARTLAEDNGVSVVTAQRALRDLQDMGLVHAIPGKGSYIHPQAVENLPGSEPHMQRQGAMIAYQQAILLNHEERVTLLEDTVIALMNQVNVLKGVPNDPELETEVQALRDKLAASRQDDGQPSTGE
jgi:DNA-binding GntR family transcriptional regulator